VHINLQLQNLLLQNPGLEETKLQEAPPEDAPTQQQCTSPTEAYKLQKDKLQRLPPQPFERPPTPKLVNDSSNELPTQPQQIAIDLQVSPRAHTKPSSPPRHIIHSELDTPTPQLRSRRARPIHVKRHPDMIYY